MAKYDVWGRIGRTRKRLRGGFSSEHDARHALAELAREGIIDLIVVQRPPAYGRIKGLQMRGLRLEKNVPKRKYERAKSPSFPVVGVCGHDDQCCNRTDEPQTDVSVLLMDKIADGKIVLHHANADWIGVLVKLGVIAAPGGESLDPQHYRKR